MKRPGTPILTAKPCCLIPGKLSFSNDFLIFSVKLMASEKMTLMFGFYLGKESSFFKRAIETFFMIKTY